MILAMAKGRMYIRRNRSYKKIERGYEYIELSKDTPQELMNEYMDFVMEQD